jgi:hypothetical protein
MVTGSIRECRNRSAVTDQWEPNMKNLGIAIILAACAGTAQALPPVLGPASATTNLAAGAVGPPDGNGRITVINSPAGGQQDSGPGARTVDQACPGLVSCYGQAASYVAYGPAPSANATAYTNLNGTMPDWVVLYSPTQVGSASSVTMQYQFAVSGTPNTTAYVDLVSFMQIAGGGVGGALSLSSFAGFSVDGPGGRWVNTFISSGGSSLQRQTRDLLGNAVFTTQPAPSSGIFVENEIVPFAANTAYTIKLYANASAFAQVVSGGNALQGSASAFVDPHFTIDPMTPDAAAYSIFLSTGIGNATPVPEPASITLLAAGLIALSGWRLWQQRRQRAGSA